jgi:hypothetical protein
MRQGFQPLADCRTGGLADWRTGGLADWRTGGLANCQLPTANCQLTTASAGRADCAVKVVARRD